MALCFSIPRNRDLSTVFDVSCLVFHTLGETHNNFQPCSCILSKERGSLERELAAEMAVFRASCSDCYANTIKKLFNKKCHAFPQKMQGDPCKGLSTICKTRHAMYVYT